MSKCWFCDGSGFWASHKRQQTLFCPACRSDQSAHQALVRNLTLSWYPSYWDQLEARYYGPRFAEPPWLLVIHSGDQGDGVAEYLHNPGDGRKVSAHISWSREASAYVQQVPLSHVAWHCGGSRYKGHRKLNWCSIGIELPGPWHKDRSDNELDLVRQEVVKLRDVLPLMAVVRHSDIDPRKRDPGPGFRVDCLDGLGLELC